MPSVIGVDTWKGVGYIMVILIAGIEAIPREYYEAAEIDGASGWQSFMHITIPLLMPVLAVITVLNLLYGLKIFDIVFVLDQWWTGTCDRYGLYRHLSTNSPRGATALQRRCRHFCLWSWLCLVIS